MRKIRTGDEVIVISGRNRGQTGRVREVIAEKDRVVIEDLHATIYRALGISPKLAYTVEERPFYVTRDGLGKPIDSLFA